MNAHPRIVSLERPWWTKRRSGRPVAQGTERTPWPGGSCGPCCSPTTTAPPPAPCGGPAAACCCHTSPAARRRLPVRPSYTIWSIPPLPSEADTPPHCPARRLRCLFQAAFLKQFRTRVAERGRGLGDGGGVCPARPLALLWRDPFKGAKMPLLAILLRERGSAACAMAAVTSHACRSRPTVVPSSADAPPHCQRGAPLPLTGARCRWRRCAHMAAGRPPHHAGAQPGVLPRGNNARTSCSAAPASPQQRRLRRVLEAVWPHSGAPPCAAAAS